MATPLNLGSILGWFMQLDTSLPHGFLEKEFSLVQVRLACYNHNWKTSPRLLKTLRTTSHTRLRTRDHFTSSTLIAGKGGAGPSSLHTTLEGPTEYVNARWM